MSEQKLKGILDTSMEKLRTMVDADVVIGTPIVLGELTLIPVSKVAFGLATGGSDIPNKTQQEVFGGASGAGVTVSPVGFLSVKGDSVRMIPVTTESTAVDRAIAAAPEIIEKITDVFATKE
ncbi:MAG: GerW family sporulation protein [Acutalibacteraceae bacterium]|nr:GerW family sporulation protein [Acutalibacteraceae bacterium]